MVDTEKAGAELKDTDTTVQRITSIKTNKTTNKTVTRTVIIVLVDVTKLQMNVHTIGEAEEEMTKAQKKRIPIMILPKKHHRRNPTLDSPEHSRKTKPPVIPTAVSF